jgi:FtsP/CotA-like multicopper oxidase with cupredoxin domain
MTLALAGLFVGAPLLVRPTARSGNPEIATHDNRAAAGTLRDGVLTINLVAGPGTWFPEKGQGPGHDLLAFGEEGGPLSIPGPMIRVPMGTEIRATVRNTLRDAPLTVHGFFDRPGAPQVVTIPPGEARRVTFRANAAGTHFYWASVRGATALPQRFGIESQLSGVIIVDPPGARTDEHVFLIGVEDDSGAFPGDRELLAAVFNGRSWPHSQVTTVTVGDTVRMRWVNSTARGHPIHLHGFYFSVERHGDIAADTSYSEDQKRLVVTEFLAPGQTMSVSWVPERPGNWLMHCHNAAHMSPHLRRGSPAASGSAGHRNHTMESMSGLVTGWRVLPRGGRIGATVAETNYRQLRLHVQSAERAGAAPLLGFVLQTGAAAPPRDSVAIPGSPIVLTRGEPVEIRVINHLPDATSIHWHGIELESYFDGVSGWSGDVDRLAPPVAPGDSFAVRFTPPRSGTFIYHSHFEEEHQLSSGMFGPLIVVEPGTRYDPAIDRHWVLGQIDAGARAVPTLNGSASPQLDFVAGRQHRVRVININPNVPLLLEVLDDSLAVQWRAIAKDGADLPATQMRLGAARVRLGAGETADFEFTPQRPGELKVRAMDPVGRVRIDGIIRVRAPGS